MNNIDEILASTGNRHYPLPGKKWKYFQQWHHALFFHYEVPAYFLQRHMPTELELDSVNGTTWISLVVFKVRNMRMRNMPTTLQLYFLEINVRTYAVSDQKPGIYMFSIETDKLLEMLLTRAFIGLPTKKPA